MVVVFVVNVFVVLKNKILFIYGLIVVFSELSVCVKFKCDDVVFLGFNVIIYGLVDICNMVILVVSINNVFKNN